jgi:protein TonB
MPRDLFTAPSAASPSPRATRLLPISIALHVVLVCSAVIAPLFAVGDLPGVPSKRTIAVLATAKPLPEITVRLERPRAVPSPDPPTAVPPPLVTDPPPPGRTLIGPSGNVAPDLDYGPPTISGVGTVDAIGAAGPGPTGPPAVDMGPQPGSGPLRIGGGIERPRKIRDVVPEYPAIARNAGIQGTVVIDAIIGPDGRVTRAAIRESRPLLDQAALAAVRQWVYTPTRLNGIPVAVIMTVEVRFTLGR